MDEIKKFVQLKIEANDGDDNKDKEEDDNGAEYTLKPLIDLKEQQVPTGHDDETLLVSFKVRKLYRWGRDVADLPCWKSRASNSSIEFYQNNNSNKVRMVCRENVTNKLRLNQYVLPLKDADIKNKGG